MSQKIVAMLFVVALAQTPNATGKNSESLRHREPKTRREFCEIVLPRILNGELTGTTTRSASRIMSPTNWLQRIAITPAPLSPNKLAGVQENCRIYLWPDEDGWSPYCIGLEFGGNLKFGDTSQIESFFHGEDNSIDKHEPLFIRQYWVSIPEQFILYFCKDGKTRIFFVTESGALEIAGNGRDLISRQPTNETPSRSEGRTGSRETTERTQVNSPVNSE